MDKAPARKLDYRKVVADLQHCEERYQGLVNSIEVTDDLRLQSAMATLKSEVRHRRRLEAELLTAVEMERQRIGQDLHDDLCQRLGAAALITSVVAKKLGRKDGNLGAELAKIPQLINDTIESCRSIAQGLHPISLQKEGLRAALDELASRMPNDGIRFSWPDRGAEISVDPTSALHLYRIIEEAVANAVKHSRGKNVSVELKTVGRRLVVAISDDGKGFDQHVKTKGMGLDKHALSCGRHSGKTDGPRPEKRRNLRPLRPTDSTSKTLGCSLHS